jgi:hypothetical protein
LNGTARDEAAKGIVSFTEAAVRAHLERHHPFCPEEVRRALIERIVGRPWTGPKIGQAAGIAATTYVRHCLTDYERLMKITRLRRDEARLIVQGEVADIIASWSGAAAPLTVDERAARSAARNRARRRRKSARRRRRAAADQTEGSIRQSGPHVRPDAT